MKTKADYTNYAKDCSNKMKTNKATSLSILSFCKTIIDDNCLRLSTDHLEELLNHIHKLKESKLFKPINQPKISKNISKQQQKDHADIFGDCTKDFDETHLRIEDDF